MKYLFFDIECATCHDGAKICEFGYVLTDENFQTLEKELFIINPKSPFDWYVINKMLAFKKTTYRKAPPYPEFYEKIKSILTDGETMVFGYGVEGDAKYLNDESERYKLPYIDFEFFDVCKMFKAIVPSAPSCKIGSVCEQLGIEIEHAHESVCDARATMLIAKELVARTGKELDELSRDTSFRGATNNGKITTEEREKAARAREQKRLAELQARKAARQRKKKEKKARAAGEVAATADNAADNKQKNV